MKKAALVGVTLLWATPGQADETARRKTEHKVEQALLYLKMGIPQRSVESLSELVKAPPGDRDPIAWLGLGRAQYVLHNIDEAGAAVVKAESYGLDKRLDKVAWASKFYRKFQDSVGGIRVRAPCDRVQFSMTLASPLVDKDKREILEAVPGWRKKSLVRSTLKPFYMPSGKYKMGDVKVDLSWSKEASITAQEIGATCTDAKIAVARGTNDPAGGVITQKPEESSFFERTWPWWAVGAAVLIAGGTGVAVATSGGGGQEFNFR